MQARQSPRPHHHPQLRRAWAWPRQSGLLLALLIALALRALLWNRIPRTSLISDEGEYLSAADWLAHGRGFAWYLSYLWTRAPLYPLFVAAHLRLFGETLAPLYLSQIALSLLNVAQVYWLARMLAPAALRHGEAVPTLAALLMGLYYPFAVYPQTALSETLFLALLLGAFLALGALFLTTKTPRHEDTKINRNSYHLLPITYHLPWPSTPNRQLLSLLILAGVLFGLATLTRSLTLLFLPVVALWLLIGGETSRQTDKQTRKFGSRFWVLGSGRRRTWGSWSLVLRPSACIAFVLAAALVILPWTIYNSRLYGGLVLVDTSGAFNLMLGGRTAYDGNNRLDAPSRNFVRALVDQNLTSAQREQLIQPIVTPNGTVLSDGPCLLRQGDPRLQTALGRADRTSLAQAQVQQLLSAEGICLIRARPIAFFQKSLAEFVDLFQINYSGDERFTDNFTTGRLPQWYALGLFLLDDTLYVLALPLAVLGWALMRNDERRRMKDENKPSSFILHPSSFILLIGLWWLYNLAVAPLLFAINRFRLPLMPFAFIFAAYAIVNLRGWRALRTRAGATWATLAALLFLLAATPYAYLLPLNERGESAWASYLGPYPSSLVDTIMALRARPAYERSEELRLALRSGAAAPARALLASGPLTPDARRFGPGLLDALEGRYAEALRRLPQRAEIIAAKDVKAAVVYADLLRSSGDPSARSLFSEQFVDNANPVPFAWDWLHPAPAREIDIAGNLDLGYISGCYLGEGDSSIKPAANFRWCTDGARIRFPNAGTGGPQSLTLRADGRGWAGYGAPPAVQVFAGDQLAGSFTPTLGDPADFVIALPPFPAGADIEITLRMPTFVPDAARYLSQQGSQVGQVQRLGVRLDWVKLAEARQ